MDSKPRRFTSALAALVAACVLIPLAPRGAAGQQRNEPSFDIRRAADEEMKEYVLETLALGLPPSRVDTLSWLALNRSGVVVPLLASRLEERLEAPGDLDRTDRTMADVLAYAGDEIALHSLARLSRLRPEQFGCFVERLLDYASTRRNPFTLAYAAVEIGPGAMSDAVVRWVLSSSERRDRLEQWAQVIRQRQSDRGPVAALASDPLVSRAPAGTARELGEATKATSSDSAKPRAGKQHLGTEP